MKCLIVINHPGNADIDYPGRITIYGLKPLQSYTNSESRCFGQYSSMPGVSNWGKPVWKHDGRDDRLFFASKNNYWFCGKNWDPEIGTNEFNGTKYGYISSTNKIKEDNFSISWSRWVNSTWKTDSSIIVEGNACLQNLLFNS